MSQAAEAEYDEEADADAQQCVKQRLHTDAIDNEDEQCETDEEGESLQPKKGAARGVRSGSFGLFREFFCVRDRPVLCELFSRLKATRLLLLTPGLLFRR
jgi:hypothetical protein